MPKKIKMLSVTKIVPTNPSDGRQPLAGKSLAEEEFPKPGSGKALREKLVTRSLKTYSKK